MRIKRRRRNFRFRLKICRGKHLVLLNSKLKDLRKGMLHNLPKLFLHLPKVLLNNQRYRKFSILKMIHQRVGIMRKIRWPKKK